MINLYRVDDRLIHGQVVEGWIPFLSAKEIIVVSNDIAKDALRTSIMRFATPEAVNLKVLTVTDAATYIKEVQENNISTIVLFPSLEEVKQTIENGIVIKKLNIGGMLNTACKNLSSGKAVFLSDSDKEILKKFIAAGIIPVGRAVPSDSPIHIADYIEN